MLSLEARALRIGDRVVWLHTTARTVGGVVIDYHASGIRFRFDDGLVATLHPDYCEYIEREREGAGRG